MANSWLFLSGNPAFRQLRLPDPYRFRINPSVKLQLHPFNDFRSHRTVDLHALYGEIIHRDSLHLFQTVYLVHALQNPAEHRINALVLRTVP